MFYACSQRQQQQQEQVEWRTEREGRGGEVREAEQTKCEWCAQVESKRLLATRFSRFTRTLEVIRKLIKQIKYCYEEKAIITHKGGVGGVGVVSLRRHLAKTIWGTHEVRWQHLDKAVTNGAEGGNWLGTKRLTSNAGGNYKFARGGRRVCVCWVVYEMH